MRQSTNVTNSNPSHLFGWNSGQPVLVPAPLTKAQYDAFNEGSILAADGGIYALSEVATEVTPTPSGTTDYSSKTAYSHYRCTTAVGNITITCVGSGKVLVPTTALALGTFPIFGAGHSGKLAIEPGDGDVRVVMSGAGVAYVGLEP